MFWVGSSLKWITLLPSKVHTSFSIFSQVSQKCRSIFLPDVEKGGIQFSHTSLLLDTSITFHRWTKPQNTTVFCTRYTRSRNQTFLRMAFEPLHHVDHIFGSLQKATNLLSRFLVYLKLTGSLHHVQKVFEIMQSSILDPILLSNQIFSLNKCQEIAHIKVNKTNITNISLFSSLAITSTLLPCKWNIVVLERTSCSAIIPLAPL